MTILEKSDNSVTGLTVQSTIIQQYNNASLKAQTDGTST